MLFHFFLFSFGGEEEVTNDKLSSHYSCHLRQGSKARQKAKGEKQKANNKRQVLQIIPCRRRLAQVNPQSRFGDTSNHDEHFDENGKLRKVKWENLSKMGKNASLIMLNTACLSLPSILASGGTCCSPSMVFFNRRFNHVCGWRLWLYSIYGVPGIIPSITAGIGGLGFGTVCFSYIGYVGAKMRNKAGSEESRCTITVYADASPCHFNGGIPLWCPDGLPHGE